MTPDEFLSLADNPNFISGIYNYCDRWCEQCHMTNRCLLFASTPKPEETMDDPVEEKGHAMMRQVEESLSIAVDLLNRMAVEQGVDLNEPVDDSCFQERKRKQKQARSSPLSLLAKEYLDKTHLWLKNSEEVGKFLDEELNRVHMLQLPDRNPEQEVKDLKLALDTIHWYFFQINVKLVRAQSHEMILPGDEDEKEFEAYDAAGSAKVAIIGIERSMWAWRKLLQYLPQQEEVILSTLSILERLLHMTETAFPRARGFVRPGLDDQEERVNSFVKEL